MVRDFHLRDNRACQPRHQRNKSVHLTVKRHPFDNRCPISLQRTPIVVNRNPCQLGDNPISSHRRHTPRPKLILPLLPPTTNQIIASVKLSQHARNVNRIILQIAIHADDVFTARILKTRRHCRRLPSILLKPNNPQTAPAANRNLQPRPRKFCMQRRQHRESIVTATIVNE